MHSSQLKYLSEAYPGKVERDNDCHNYSSTATFYCGALQCPARVMGSKICLQHCSEALNSYSMVLEEVERKGETC